MEEIRVVKSWLGLLLVGLFLAGGCGSSSGSSSHSSASTQMISASIMLSNGGNLTQDLPGITLYDSTWVPNLGFRLGVLGTISGGTPPYRVSVSYPTKRSTVAYYSNVADWPIIGSIYVPAHGDPRVLVQIADSSKPPLTFERRLPLAYQKAPAKPLSESAPLVRITEMSTLHPGGCGATLSVIVNTPHYEVYWTGGIYRGERVSRYNAPTLQALFSTGERVQVVVRDIDPAQGGRPAAEAWLVVC